MVEQLDDVFFLWHCAKGQAQQALVWKERRGKRVFMPSKVKGHFLLLVTGTSTVSFFPVYVQH